MKARSRAYRSAPSGGPRVEEALALQRLDVIAYTLPVEAEPRGKFALRHRALLLQRKDAPAPVWATRG